MESTPISTNAWWAARRMRYNIGLVIAGILAFIAYCIVCQGLLPRVLDQSEIEITIFTTLFQGIGYLVMMGVANVLYFLGPLSERIIRPTNIDKYRRTCYALGFWFSVLLPFSIPMLLTILVLFFPNYWKE
jgi:hypothetical protein